MKKNRIALITEAGNGLAHKFASILNKQGFDTIIVAKGNSYIELDKMNLKDTTLLELDIAQTDAMIQLYSYIKKSYGKLDVLINNAEIANGFGQKITELHIEDVKKLYDENLFSVINVIKTLFGLLNNSPYGRIINITSALGSIEKMKDGNFCYSDYRMTAYSTAKAALEMLTVLLNKEFKATHIKVVNFDPVRLKNSTHNDVVLCNAVKKEFLDLVYAENPVEIQ